MPRRAWQRRSIVRAAASIPPVAGSKQTLRKQAFKACREGSADLVQEWPGEDSRFSWSSDSENDEDYQKRRPVARRIEPAEGVHKVRAADSLSDSLECLKSEPGFGSGLENTRYRHGIEGT